MKEQDDLQAIFKNMDTVHAEMDLEALILQKIEAQRKVKKQIARNRRYGLLGIFVTFILVALFIWLYNDPNLQMDFRNPLVQLGTCAFVLILLFLQLETALGHSRQRITNDS